MLADGALREQAEQYRAIFEATSDGLVISNLDGYVVEVNPAACEMYGYSYEEFIGLPRTAIVHPDSHHLIDATIETAQVGGTIRFEAVDMRKDGSPFYVDGRGTRFIYRGTTHLLVVVRDVTERIRARELLEQRVAERTRELSTLLDVSRNVTSTLHLQPLLDLILGQLKSVVDYTGAGIFVLEGDEARIVGFRSPWGPGALPQVRFPVSGQDGALSLSNSPRPTVIDDVRDSSPLAIELREVLGDSLDTYYSFVRSWMAVPMSVKDRLIGYVHLAHGVPNFYSSHHADLALAIAQQAAIAIENARLYEQAQDLAVLEERQRLSRELHDSVSQALYGIALAAETTRVLLERDPERAAQSNETIRSLAGSGMAEMRALLFELRPESLELEGLVVALRKQADAIQARYQISVTVNACDEPTAALSIKEALYRICQEALHNAVKHARPASITVNLQWLSDELMLEVTDDGIGFDTSSSFPGHLGLRSMRERVAKQGGTLTLHSAPGEGTQIRAVIPARSSA